MKILLIGSGGREHALAWTLVRSPQVKQLYSTTGNAGILRLSTRADVDVAKISEVADFAVREKIDLVVIGPEQPLVDGLVDALMSRGVPAFGRVQSPARVAGRQ